jgi:hypothetical protein
MKNLANCKPSEFLKQTNRIKKSVEKWMKATDLMAIRAVKPKFTEDMTAVERREAVRKQGLENFSRIFDAAVEDHPDETLELLALMCFVEPENVDDHTVAEYLDAVTELIQDKAVVGFFTSLASLGLTHT